MRIVVMWWGWRRAAARWKRNLRGQRVRHTGLDVGPMRVFRHSGIDWPRFIHWKRRMDKPNR